MCGITGSINWGDSQTLAKMTATLAHRGPDDSGLWETQTPTGQWVGLGSRRLAIIDLSPAGHMPMSNEDGTIWITFNGEIYNFAALRQELLAKGHTFRSNSDTETIVHLYEEMGPDCVKRLNGIFALAIWDTKQESLFLARDHFGIKPLYYIHQGQRLAFSSEVKAFYQLPDCPRELDLEALHYYLTFLWVPDPLTMFRQIFKLEAGHYALFKDGQLHIKQYWDLTFPEKGHAFPKTEGELVEEVRRRLFASIQGQMVSDVPIGAFLSAGLDSSAIVAAMSAVSQEPVRTYTIAFPEKYRLGESTLDDTDVARRTARHFGCQHTEIVVEPNVVELLPQLIWYMDEPTADPAIITAYLVSREARREVTVLLSGIGGDEIFAGYRKYRAGLMAQTYQKIPGTMRRYLLEPMIGALPAFDNTSLKGKVRLAQKFARSGSLPPREQFIMNGTYLNNENKWALYSPQMRTATSTFNASNRHLAHFARVEQSDWLNQMLYLDAKVFMTSLNLTYNDKMSMATSVEVRVPFLDWELAEFIAWHVPPSLKLHKRTTKYILRQALQGILPAEVLNQPKAGFGAPIGYWLTHDLRDLVADLLTDQVIKDRGYFEPAAIKQMLAEHYTGRRDRSYQIWQLLTFELWLQTFIDKKPVTTNGLESPVTLPQLTIS
jgi:asparagine synthase (glutamine-hydrolysing)